MSRRSRSVKRDILPDPIFKSKLISKFINHVMLCGKKSIAEKIVYSAFNKIQSLHNIKDIVKFFESVIEKISPIVEVRSRRVGGATYQVPVEVRPERQITLAMRWIISVSRKRKEKDMSNRIARELIEAMQGKGNAIKKRDDAHKMAESNKAFAHFRW